MNSHAYHPNTRLVLDSLVSNPKQSVLILGDKGSGKHTIVLDLISRIINIQGDKLATSPYLKTISGEDSPITIESIREIQSFIKLKVPGTNLDINRVILIENASNMSTEAQNSLLKMLEEPPAKTMFVLTAIYDQGLLDTVVSRMIKISILPISKPQALKFFQTDYSKEQIEKAYAISGGRAGLLSSILNSVNHPLISDIDLAKRILAEKSSVRLLRVDSLAKEKEVVRNLVVALQNICHAALNQAATAKNAVSTRAWLARLELVQKAEVLLTKNANTKLLLDDLFIKL